MKTNNATAFVTNKLLLGNNMNVDADLLEEKRSEHPYFLNLLYSLAI